MTEVLVLGAGPAGLGAAFRLAVTGKPATVLERAGRVGGAAGSVTVGGMRVDLGSHRLHPSVEPRILEDLKLLLGDDLQQRQRNGRIRLNGRWVAFPMNPKDLARNMPLGFMFGAARDAVTSPFRRPKADTFAEVLRSGLGSTICRDFYFPYARKIWGVAPEELSGEQARRRVAADSPLKLLARVVRGSGSGGARGASYFWYPREGYGQISEAVVEAARRKGAAIHLGVAAEAVASDADGVTVTGSDGIQRRADLVLSTIPAAILARITGPSPEVARAAGALRSRSMLLVYLILDVDRYTSFDAHYLPEAFTPVTRVSEPKNYRDGDEPIGRTVLCAEIPCDRSDDLWSASDETLRDLVAEGLRAAGLPRPGIVSVHVERLAFAYPIYDLGYESHLDTIETWLEKLPRVITFGRQGLFVHDNAHHALSMAYAAADCVGPDGDFDHERWELARGRFAEHVVED